MTSGSVVLACLGFCSVFYNVFATIPNGFTLDVNVDCGKKVSDNPVIKVVSDMSLQVVAYCDNGNATIKTTDGVNYILTGSYSDKKSNCQFTKKKGANIFTADVSIAYGLIGSTLQQAPQFYTLTCTFDKNGKEKTTPVDVTRGFIAPVELRVDAGKKTTSAITLDVYNVKDKVVTSAIMRGCKVYLRALTDGSNSELGLRPAACDAINPKTNNRLPILRAGCGTGLVLPKGSGFTTKDKVTRSSYFKAVQFGDNAEIQFECVFVLCKTKCDGNSCKVSRRKRSASDMFLGAVVRSLPSEIHPLIL